MTSTSSHSSTRRGRHGGRPLRSCRPTATVLLLSTSALVLTVPTGTLRGPRDGHLLPVASPFGAAAALAAARLMTILPDARIFRWTPAASIALLMFVNSAVLWFGILSVRPVVLLTRQPSSVTALTLAATTTVAVACTTVAIAAGVDAHDLRHAERHWGGKPTG